MTGLKIAYLVNQYPKISHSFIRREILALERQGLEVMRFAVRGWEGDLVDPEDLRERQRTYFVLQDGLWGLVVAMLQLTVRNPGRLFAAAWLALRMGIGADRALPYHMAYLAEACWIASRIVHEGGRHLHAHFGTNSAEVAMLVHVLCDIPFSFTVHGPDEFDKAEFIGLAEKIRRCAFVVAVSSFGRSQLLRWVGSECWNKVHIVHCGLEREFHDVPAAAVPDCRRLVCVGRLSEQKGQLLLIEAAAVLAREGVAFELVLAGDGEMRGQIDAQVARYALERNVRITGWLDGGQVRAEILAARALVLPSFAEGLPVVLMEAMALRRPVLSTFIAGIPELVIPGENGWLFPAGSVRDLVEAMKACLAMPAARLAEMGDRARDRALLRHDVDREAARLAEYFRAAASGKLASGAVT